MSALDDRNDVVIREHARGYTVVDLMSGEVAPLALTRERAVKLRDAIRALDEHDFRRLRAGMRPAPGCEWLIPRG